MRCEACSERFFEVESHAYLHQKHVPRSRSVKELTRFNSFKDSCCVAARKSSTPRLLFHLSESFSFLDWASKMYVVGSISSIIKMSLRSLSGVSRLFSMKESPTFAKRYQWPPTPGPLKLTDFHPSVEVKEDRAAIERAMSQTKLFVYVEEAVHHLLSVSMVSCNLIDNSAYLSADCRDLEGFQRLILQNTCHVPQ